jgi:hypothetical protein
MFDKEGYRKSLKEFSPGLSEEFIDRQVELKAKNQETVKKGPNVVHLDYFSGIIDEGDINDFEETLTKADLVLSRYDKSGVVYASLQEFTLQVAIAFGPNLVSSLVQSATWDAIKVVTKKSWQLVRSRNLRSVDTNQTHELNFGLKISFQNNKVTEFHLQSGFSPEVYEKAMDKILEFALKQDHQPVASNGLADFMEFDTTSDDWGKVDVMAKFRERAEEQSRLRNQG